MGRNRTSEVVEGGQLCGSVDQRGAAVFSIRRMQAAEAPPSKGQLTTSHFFQLFFAHLLVELEIVTGRQFKDFLERKSAAGFAWRLVGN